LAARKVKQKLISLAAHMLSADAATLILSQGGIQVAGDALRRLPMAQVAQAAYLGHALPAGMEPGIDERMAFDPPSLAITYGAALVEVDVAADTGAVQIRRILFAHDCGPQIRPDIVEGQVIGGIVQGIGAALYERLAYSQDGTPMTSRMADYHMPLMADVPPIELVHLETPSPFFPNGAKGVGESGVIPMPAAIANAVRDALGSATDADRLNSLPLLML
jgi:carbon-monoxide dehydrogenase large subunit